MIEINPWITMGVNGETGVVSKFLTAPANEASAARG